MCNNGGLTLWLKAWKSLMSLMKCPPPHSKLNRIISLELHNHPGEAVELVSDSPCDNSSGHSSLCHVYSLETASHPQLEPELFYADDVYSWGGWYLLTCKKLLLASHNKRYKFTSLWNHWVGKVQLIQCLPWNLIKQTHCTALFWNASTKKGNVMHLLSSYRLISFLCEQ